MGEKLYYLVEVCIFTFVALYFIFKPEEILRVLRLDKSTGAGVIIRVIAVIAAVGNAIVNMNRFLH